MRLKLHPIFPAGAGNQAEEPRTYRQTEHKAKHVLFVPQLQILEKAGQAGKNAGKIVVRRHEQADRQRKQPAGGDQRNQRPYQSLCLCPAPGAPKQTDKGVKNGADAEKKVLEGEDNKPVQPVQGYEVPCLSPGQAAAAAHDPPDGADVEKPDGPADSPDRIVVQGGADGNDGQAAQPDPALPAAPPLPVDQLGQPNQKGGKNHQADAKLLPGQIPVHKEGNIEIGGKIHAKCGGFLPPIRGKRLFAG